MHQHKINDLVEDCRRFGDTCTHPISAFYVSRLPATRSTKLSSRCMVWRCTLPPIEPESELVDVAIKVLFADMVEGAVDARPSARPNRLDAVGRDAIADVFVGLDSAD
jgi:hypothetical protein